MDNKLEKIFIYFLLILPFVIWKGAYEGPKVYYFFLGIIPLFIYWIYAVLKSGKSFEFSRADVFYFIWLLILTLSSLIGIHPIDSILGGSYRHQGVLFFLSLWITAKTIQSLSAKGKEFLIKGLGFVILTESVVALFQFVTGGLYFGRPLGTLGEANALAGFVAVGIYFVYVTFPKFVIFLPIAAIISTISRSGILSVLPYLGLYINSWGKKFKIIFPIIILIAATFLVIISGSRGSSFFENRLTIWSFGISEIIKKPILGFGAESGEAVYNLAFYKHGFPLYRLIVDRSHNIILDVLIWSGGLGLIFFAGWLYFSFKEIKKIEMKLAFLSFLIFSMFQPLSIVHWILLIIIINI